MSFDFKRLPQLGQREDRNSGILPQEEDGDVDFDLDETERKRSFSVNPSNPFNNIPRWISGKMAASMSSITSYMEDQYDYIVHTPSEEVYENATSMDAYTMST